MQHVGEILRLNLDDATLLGNPASSFVENLYSRLPTAPETPTAPGHFLTKQDLTRFVPDKVVSSVLHRSS